MVLASWLTVLHRLTFLVGKSPSRRRSARIQRLNFGIAGAAEQYEDRALLSAAPVVDLALVGPVNVTEGATPVVIAPTATVSDADSTTFDGGTLTATLTANAVAADQLGINNQGMAAGQIGVSGSNVTYGGTVIGTFLGGLGTTPLVVTLNSNATVPAVQALQDNITFQTSDDPTVSSVGDASADLPRTFQTVITDAAGGNSSLPATATIDVLEAVPAVTLSETQLTVTNSSPHAIDPGIQIAASGTGGANGAVLQVSLTNATANDQLGLLNFGRSRQSIRVNNGTLQFHGTSIGTITGIGTSQLTITFNEHATLSEVQQVARSITFRSISHATHQTTATFQFSDTEGTASNSASLLINVKRGGKPSGNPGVGGNGGGGNGGGNGGGGNGHGHQGGNNGHHK
ncbi:MAG: hypothetical protein JWM11_5339 [Planctomycetaceae bacterium]|nr:hypothetical protein [Planctomycetaceae bacterium]